jgi:hypothetical protein
MAQQRAMAVPPPSKTLAHNNIVMNWPDSNSSWNFVEKPVCPDILFSVIQPGIYLTMRTRISSKIEL